MGVTLQLLQHLQHLSSLRRLFKSNVFIILWFGIPLYIIKTSIISCPSSVVPRIGSWACSVRKKIQPKVLLLIIIYINIIYGTYIPYDVLLLYCLHPMAVPLIQILLLYRYIVGRRANKITQYVVSGVI